MQETGYCYKHMSDGKPAQRIRRRFKTKTGKEAPHVDTWMFRRDKPSTYAQHGYKDGKVEGLTYHPRNKVVGILIKVYSYRGYGLHSIHAISAVKLGNTLYGFNAWGRNGLPIDSKIFRQIAKIYKCKKVDMYNGPSLQVGNAHGVCVGFASNFVTEMLLLNHHLQGENIRNYFQTMNSYNKSIFNSLSVTGQCFGEGIGACNLNNQRARMQLNLEKTQVTPARKKGTKRTLRSIEKNLSPQYMPLTPLPNKAIPLRQYASTRCIKGYSKYTKKSTLSKHIYNYQYPRILSYDNVKKLKAIDLRKYAGLHCVKGKSKATKKSDLFKLVKNALYG